LATSYLLQATSRGNYILASFRFGFLAQSIYLLNLNADGDISLGFG